MQAVVSERLSVRLEPVDLRLKPPSAQEFHDSLQHLFATGITQKNVVKVGQGVLTPMPVPAIG